MTCARSVFLVGLLLIYPRFLPTVSAANKLTIDTPTDVVQCQTVFITWHGGEAPYSLEIYDSIEPLGIVGITSHTSYLWIADVDPSYNPLSFILQSDDSQTVRSNPFNVTAAPQNCSPTSSGTGSMSLSAPMSTSSGSISTTANGSSLTSPPSFPSSSASATSTAAAESRHDSTNKGLIAGVTVGGAILLLLLSLGLFWFCRRRNEHSRDFSVSPLMATPQPPPQVYEPQEEPKQTPLPEASPLEQGRATLPTPLPERTAFVVRNGADSEAAVAAGSSPLHPLPEKRRNRRFNTAGSPPVVFMTTNQTTSSSRRREEDGGVRVDVSDFDDDLDDSATLPPAYSEIRQTTGVWGRGFLPRSVG